MNPGGHAPPYGASLWTGRLDYALVLLDRKLGMGKGMYTGEALADVRLRDF
jgi:hypothetical protein